MGRSGKEWEEKGARKKWEGDPKKGRKGRKGRTNHSKERKAERVEKEEAEMKQQEAR